MHHKAASSLKFDRWTRAGQGYRLPSDMHVVTALSPSQDVWVFLVLPVLQHLVGGTSLLVAGTRGGVDPGRDELSDRE